MQEMAEHSPELAELLFEKMDRTTWSKLSEVNTVPLTPDEIAELRGLGDPLDIEEVQHAYLPLTTLINVHLKSLRRLNQNTNAFLGLGNGHRIPFVIGIAGSVAVGKSTIARLLQELLRRWSDSPKVDLVTTDGFLYPNAELEKRGLMHRKGFPESYDQRALLEFVTQIKSGVETVRAPKYDHVTYDILPDAEIVVNSPDILIIEGLNVLQPPRPGGALALSDLFDFSIYLDAPKEYLLEWYVNRFLKLKAGAFTHPKSYFHRYADLSEELAIDTAKTIWNAINLPNLLENIQPTKPRAHVIIQKSINHTVEKIYLRKL